MVISIRKRDCAFGNEYIMTVNGSAMHFRTTTEMRLYIDGEKKAYASAFDSAMETTMDWELREKELQELFTKLKEKNEKAKES